MKRLVLHPEMFTQLDELRRAERENGRHSVDHQMIKKQWDAGTHRKQAAHGQLARRRWAIKENELPGRRSSESKRAFHEFSETASSPARRTFSLTNGRPESRHSFIPLVVT